MISIAIIIFREIFEVAIILSVLAAATRNIKNRGKWISLGLFGGAMGSFLVACGADAISRMAEGMGQELFNATVLFLAALLIAWTVIWMSRYGRFLTQHFKEIGHKVFSGAKPLYTLSIVILLAMLREGSEMVLFSYGVIAFGEQILRVLLGIILGLITGTMAGFALYFGLIKISPKKIFSVTSWLLVFLAAGMASQAFGFLTAAGYVPALGEAIWDTSHLLPENNIVGMLFHSLVGYTARPSGIELISFAATFFAISLILKLYGVASAPHAKHVSGSKISVAAIVLMIGIFSFSPPAWAIKKVYSPRIEKGELELEARGNYDFDKDNSVKGQQTQKYAVGYGVTDHWFTELYGQFEKVPGEKENFEFTTLEWENRFQFFEPGEKWVDVGLYFANEFSFEKDSPNEIEGKLLLEKELGKFVHTANFILKKEVGGDARKEVEGGFAWSSRYRVNQYFQPGFEYHVDAGELRASIPFNSQEHLAGPVFYGKIGNVKYDVGYLFGVSKAAPDGMLKWILEYEIPL